MYMYICIYIRMIWVERERERERERCEFLLHDTCVAVQILAAWIGRAYLSRASPVSVSETTLSAADVHAEANIAIATLHAFVRASK